MGRRKYLPVSKAEISSGSHPCTGKQKPIDTAGRVKFKKVRPKKKKQLRSNSKKYFFSEA
jgi:ribosomal protein L31